MSNSNDVIDRNHYGSSYYAGHLERLKKQDRFTKVKMRRVEELLQARKGELILDLGTGVGTVLLWLLKQDVRAIAVDYSSTSLRIVRSLLPSFVPNKPFSGLCSDGRALPLQSDCLDGVVAVDFTEHLDDSTLDGTISEIFRVLKRGGRFIIYTPNPEHLFERMKDKNFVLKQDPSHIGLRSMEAYRQALTRVGFSVSQSYFEPTHIPVYGKMEGLLMKIPLIGKLAKRRICIRAEKICA